MTPVIATPLTAPTRVELGDAVAAIIVLDDGRYLLQHRDDLPDIFYPGHWGCFGGAVDEGETAREALLRELQEELGLALAGARPYCRLDFDLRNAGAEVYTREYFVLEIPGDALADMVLGEGQAMAAHTPAAVLSELMVTPYDAFALFLHHSRERWTLS